MALVVAIAAAYGTFLPFTGSALGWTGVGLGPGSEGGRQRSRGKAVREWMTQAGLGDVRISELAGVILVFASIGALVAFALIGGVLPAIRAAAFAGSFLVATYRARRAKRRPEVREAWPRMIEEMRLLTGLLGRSVPRALFDVGRRGPGELRGGFAAAQRVWMNSTDFSRTIAVSKRGRRSDGRRDARDAPHGSWVGGSDLDRRLSAPVEDRVQDLQGRKDARAKQVGVRFARVRPPRPPRHGVSRAEHR